MTHRNELSSQDQIGERLKFATPELCHKMIVNATQKTQRHELWDWWAIRQTIARNAYQKKHIFFLLGCQNIRFQNYAQDEAWGNYTTMPTTAEKETTLTTWGKFTRGKNNIDEEDKIRIRIDLFSFRWRLTLHFKAVLHVLALVCAVLLCVMCMYVATQCWFLLCVPFLLLDSLRTAFWLSKHTKLLNILPIFGPQIDFTQNCNRKHFNRIVSSAKTRRRVVEKYEINNIITIIIHHKQFINKQIEQRIQFVYTYIIWAAAHSQFSPTNNLAIFLFIDTFRRLHAQSNWNTHTHTRTHVILFNRLETNIYLKITEQPTLFTLKFLFLLYYFSFSFFFAPTSSSAAYCSLLLLLLLL